MLGAPYLRSFTRIDTMVFDYGGVVSLHYCEPWQGNISRLLRVPPEKARALLSETSPQGRAYRLNALTRDAFWASVLAQSAVDDADIAELEYNWANSYQIDYRMVTLLQLLRDRLHLRIGILSNSDRYRHDHIENTYSLSQKVDFIVSSYQHGVIKPEPAAYLKVLEVAQRTERPQSVLYVDDRLSHVAACAALGLQGYVFSTYDDFLAALAQGAPVYQAPR